MLIKAADRVEQDSRHKDVRKEVVIGRGIIPSITQVAVATLAHGQETELHSHPTMYEIYFVLEGEATYILDNKEFGVRGGDFLIVPPNTMHRQVVTRGPHRILYWGLETAPEPVV